MSDAEFRPSIALAVLLTHEVRFVVIGGLAASLLGSSMTTNDLDICYARSDQNLIALSAALHQLHAKLRGAPPDVPFQLDAESLRNGDHLTFETDAGAVDILGIPKGTKGFDQLTTDAVTVDFQGMQLQVASLEQVIRMKEVAGRPKDRLGLEILAALREVIEEGDHPARE